MSQSGGVRIDSQSPRCRGRSTIIWSVSGPCAGDLRWDTRFATNKPCVTSTTLFVQKLPPRLHSEGSLFSMANCELITATIDVEATLAECMIEIEHV